VHRRDLGTETLLLPQQFGVQRLQPAPPFLSSGFGGAFILLHCPGRLPLHAFPGRRLGAPVQDQQHQDQRAHGAQQHGQEWKGRDL
jgi:hypothetical protein